MRRLTDQEVADSLVALPGWRGDAHQIACTYEWASEAEAMSFADEVAAVAEAARHHPTLDIHRHAVTVRLVTTDEGGVTDRDIATARAIQRAAEGMADR